MKMAAVRWDSMVVVGWRNHHAEDEYDANAADAADDVDDDDDVNSSSYPYFYSVLHKLIGKLTYAKRTWHGCGIVTGNRKGKRSRNHRFFFGERKEKQSKIVIVIENQQMIGICVCVYVCMCVGVYVCRGTVIKG